MNVKISVHANHILQNKERLINQWNVPESTKKEIHRFIDEAQCGMVNEGMRLSDATLSKYLSVTERPKPAT